MIVKHKETKLFEMMISMDCKKSIWTTSFWILAILIFILPDFSSALSNVTINVPRAVKRGGNATLSCTYDLEWGNLYSVKWYKGKYEFYRYMPSGSPNIKVFILGNLRVDTSASNQTHVLLLDMQPEMSGKYTCEISMDAPDFTTAMISGELGVVELPKEQAIVTGIQPRYRIGDLVDGNCSIKYSKPAANLTWTINGIVVPPHHIKTYQIEKHENGSLESVMSALNFMVTTQHFYKGQMRLKCTASIYNIFKEEIESVIEEDRPRIMASGQSYDMHNYPYEQQHTHGDGFEDHNESYLTYYSAADTTSGATKSSIPFAMQSLKKYFQRTCFVLQILCKKAHELAAKVILLAPLSTSSSPSSSLPSKSPLTTVTTESHLSTRWTALPRILQHSSDEKVDESDVLSISKAQGNREKFTEKSGIAVLPIASCYVTLAIILTHHFMSCQNTKTTKVAIPASAPGSTSASVKAAGGRAPTAKTTEIMACDVRTNLTERTPVVTPAFVARSNKSFYNCPESVKANDGKALKLSLLKRQTLMGQWECQRQRQRHRHRQQSDCQYDDNIYDDCQEQQQQQQRDIHQKLLQERKAHSQVSQQLQRPYLTNTFASAKSNEVYVLKSNYIEATNALLSLSKDQILLMIFAIVADLTLSPFAIPHVASNVRTTKTVSQASQASQAAKACFFFEDSFQTSFHLSLPHCNQCQCINC